MRDLVMSEVTFSIHVEQDDTQVRGNAIASGEDHLDKRVEDEILARLNDGDVWAWASVRVCAEYRGATGDAYLGGCSYDDEEAFKACDYYSEMCQEALHALNTFRRDVCEDPSEDE